MKRFVVALMVLVAIYGAFVWSNAKKHPASIVEPCFDNAGRWYVMEE